MKEALSVGDLIGKGWPVLVGGLLVLIVVFLIVVLRRRSREGRPLFAFSLPHWPTRNRQPKAPKEPKEGGNGAKGNGVVVKTTGLIFHNRLQKQGTVPLLSITGPTPLARDLGGKKVLLLEQITVEPMVPIADAPALEPASVALGKVKIPKQYKGVMAYLEAIRGNGKQQTSMAALVPNMQYREFISKELPEKYQHLTPSWLHRKLHWRDRVEFLKIQPEERLQNAKVGLMVVVIIIYGILIFLIIMSMMQGK